ncbi:MAG: tyrosine-protein phosphatase, partial [Kiritimatiellae bacterium]|nr:tyrosine-protein phosphatase [Kiritimatiellia bacterium]
FLSWADCRAEFDAGTLTNRPCWQAGHMAKIYRGEHDANDPHRVPTAWARGRERLTDEARHVLLDVLGVRTDLDLRGAQEVAGMSVSPLGDRVKWANVAMTAYGGLAKSRGKELAKACLDVFLDPANYPIAFHCIGGQDRTGTLAFLIEALMGVDDDELNKDWECSGFSNAGSWFRHETLLNQIYDVLGAYPGANTRERAEAYVRDCGLDDGDIARLRDILLEQ